MLCTKLKECTSETKLFFTRKLLSSNTLLTDLCSGYFQYFNLRCNNSNVHVFYMVKLPFCGKLFITCNSLIGSRIKVLDIVTKQKYCVQWLCYLKQFWHTSSHSYVTCMACNVISILGKLGNAIISSWSRLTIGMEDRVWIIWMATGHRLAFLYSLKHCLRNPSVSE